MRLARHDGRVRVETADGLLTSEAARQVARDLERLADAADRLNAETATPGQLTTEAELGEALPV